MNSTFSQNISIICGVKEKRRSQLISPQKPLARKWQISEKSQRSFFGRFFIFKTCNQLIDGKYLQKNIINFHPWLTIKRNSFSLFLKIKENSDTMSGGHPLVMLEKFLIFDPFPAYLMHFLWFPTNFKRVPKSLT